MQPNIYVYDVYIASVHNKTTCWKNKCDVSNAEHLTAGTEVFRDTSDKMNE